MSNPFAEQLSDYFKGTSAHMLFGEACGWFGALKCGVPNHVVELAAGVSQATISHLRRAGEIYGDNPRIRYPNVAREYDRLGHDAFIARYVTDVVRERIGLAMQAPRERKPASTFVKHRSSGLIGRHILRPRDDYVAVDYLIDIVRRADGYHYLILEPQSGPPGAPASAGPFLTDRECYRVARDTLTPKG